MSKYEIIYTKWLDDFNRKDIEISAKNKKDAETKFFKKYNHKIYAIIDIKSIK